MPPPNTPQIKGNAVSSAPNRTPAVSGRAPTRTPSTRSIGKARPPSLSSLTPDPSLLLNSLSDFQKDDGTFDPIEFLNKHYTSEKQLSQQLPSLQDAVKTRMGVLNDRISNALQHHSETADSTRRHVQDAKASVIELEKRVLLVQQKAALSETAVREITADMKRLDGAKQHVQRTITTLKRLHMLVHAVEQLRTLSQQQTDASASMADASYVVEAIGELLQHFEAYTHKVQHMRVLKSKVEEYKTTLRKSVVRGFRVVVFGTRKTRELEGATIREDEEEDVADEGAAVLDVPALQGGTKFIEALGEEQRQRFIHDFCQDLLGEYLKKFEPPSHKPEKRVSSFKAAANPEPENIQSSLDQIDKRYAWFMQNPLKIVSDRFPGVFPAHWNLEVSLADMFLRLTRDHILALLDGPRKDADADSASVLLKALQKTIVFENEATGYLERDCGAVFEKKKPATEDGGGSVTDEPDPSVVPPLVGRASVAFQNYMGPYIRLEEQSMGEQITKALEDRTVDTRGERPVYISSTNLFVYMKGSITRCTALTKGNAFFLLYGAFKDSLKQYAQMIDGKLPVATQQTNNVGGIVIPFGGKQEETAATSASYRIAPNEEITVCHVVSTCEYCADTMEVLEDLIRNTIDDDYKPKIDMISDQEQFHDITAKCIRVLVSGLTNRLEGPMKEMTAIKWETWDAVGEESPYVLAVHEAIEPFVKTVRKLLPTSYFRSFCDKFANTFSVTYFESLVGLKRISEPGTQQLLLDLYNLKTLFLKLPILEESSTLPGKTNVSSGGASIAPAIYTKTIQRNFGKMEMILKLVGTPNNLLCDNFKVQWQGGTVADIQLVMNLKGMKRPEQVALLEKFGFDTPSALKGATAGLTSASIVSERVQQLQDQGSTVAAKVNSDLNQMRQKVDDFRKTFR